jgi:hypothetical protein
MGQPAKLAISHSGQNPSKERAVAGLNLGVMPLYSLQTKYNHR